MSVLRQEILQSLRALRRRPGFTVVAVVSLALGIAANTTIFSILSATVLGGVGLPDESRLVYLSPYAIDNPEAEFWVTVPEYQAWKERAQSFEAIGAMFGATRSRTLGASDDGQAAERLLAYQGERDLLDVWGVQPILGRLFTSEEDVVGEAPRVAVISHRLWQRRFNGDPNVIGQTIVLDGTPADMIGVMPEGLSATIQRPDVDLWIPWSLSPSMVVSTTGFNHVYARLKPGISLGEAQAEIDSIALTLGQELPDSNANRGVRLRGMHEFFFGDLGEPLFTLQGAVAIVLLIACANVALLLLAAASGRRIEVALRSAIGASRWRIMRQMLTESFVLAGLGGLLGLALAWAGVRLFLLVAPPDLPGLGDIEIDAGVMLLTLVIVVATALVFGSIPAVSTSRPDLSGLMNETPRGSTTGRAGRRLRLVLVTGQTALALVLLVSAGLLINSLMRLNANTLGADPNGILSFRLQFGQDQAIFHTGESYNGMGLWEPYPAVTNSFESVVERIRNVPGVETVAGSYIAPFSGAMSMTFRTPGIEPGSAESSGPDFSVAYMSITPAYFDLLRVPLIQGRGFSDDDRETGLPVAIINETMARTYWPDDSPIGRQLTLEHVPDAPARQIIGVVGDVLLGRLEEASTPTVYVPYFQQSAAWPGGSALFLRGGMSFLVRGPDDPFALVPAVRSAVAQVDRNLPLLDVSTIDQNLSDQLQTTRLFTVLLGIFGFIAGTLAAIGLYGAIAYSVAERRQEIGIRMALGAEGGNILRLVMRQAVVVIGVGLALGLAASFAVTRLLSSVLWGVTPTDAATFAAVATGLTFVALVACLIPTWRALALDPAVTLRWA